MDFGRNRIACVSRGYENKFESVSKVQHCPAFRQQWDPRGAVYPAMNLSDSMIDVASVCNTTFGRHFEFPDT